jgi:NAD(P)-dependent dehydrogenase (short-subunit alcohol dehydrogenase family)
MGRKTTQALAEKGFTVFALDKKTESVQKNIIPIQADITNEESIRCAVQTVKETTDKLFAIVHFAGIYMLDSLAEMESESFERIFRINVFGAFLINKAFLPFLEKGSRILMTTSELAPLDPLPFTGIYAVTKSTLDKYAYSLRMELQLLGIEVSVLRAGAVDTGMLGVSTRALEHFCENTALYSCNAKRFKTIVDGVEARNIAPEKIAEKAGKILGKKHTKFAYAINRNPLLLMLNALPKRTQLWVIKKILE